MLTNNFQSLEDLRFVAEKCPRCSLCKFPPLTRVEHAKFSGICPAYEEFKFHANSGSGKLIIGMSLIDGRSQPNETVRKFTYSCLTCGGCDISCKFSSDIEVLEILYQLRAKIFRELGPYPEHKAILESIERQGHPLPDEKGSMGDWMADVNFKDGLKSAEYLLWIGPHYGLKKEKRDTLKNAIYLLRGAGVSFTALGKDEPYTGRAALEIGDRELFRRSAIRSAEAINNSGARAVLCLSPEDYATLRAQTPKFAQIKKPVKHVVEVYNDLIRQNKVIPKYPVKKVAAWHDTSYLGRLSEPYTPWKGERKKVAGQITIYDPPRPVNRGGNGCYEPPRNVLNAIPGLIVRDFYRQREYTFDSGESGQAAAVMPKFAAYTALRRVSEAQDIGIELIVTECPQSVTALEKACSASGGRPKVTSLTDLLTQSLNGGAI